MQLRDLEVEKDVLQNQNYTLQKEYEESQRVLQNTKYVWCSVC